VLSFHGREDLAGYHHCAHTPVGPPIDTEY
jgi:hypothetical protein